MEKSSEKSSAKKNRAPLVGAFIAVALVVGYLVFRPKPATIGRIRMPILTGWKRGKPQRLPTLSAVGYTRRVAPSNLMIMVSWRHNPAVDDPKTIQDVRQLMLANTLPRAKAFANSKSQIQIDPIQETTFGGVPAVSSHDVVRTTERIHDNEETRFILNGKYFYVQTSAIYPANQTLDPAAKEALDQARQTLQETFKSANNSSDSSGAGE